MKASRGITHRRALETNKQTKIANTDVTPQAIWPIAKSLMTRDGPQDPTAIHGPFGLTFLPLEKVNTTADCLEMTCVTKTINGGWRLEFKLYSEL
jgi:hypothetical protein